MLTETQIQDAKSTIHNLGDLVNTQCTITVLSTLPTPQPGIYAIISKHFYPNAEKHWVSEITTKTSVSYSSKQLARILDGRGGNIIVNQH